MFFHPLDVSNNLYHIGQNKYGVLVLSGLLAKTKKKNKTRQDTKVAVCSLLMAEYCAFFKESQYFKQGLTYI